MCLNDGESMFSKPVFDFQTFTFRGAWRVNLCVVCLFGSRGRKSTFDFPSKHSKDFSLVVVVSRDGKMDTIKLSFISLLQLF